MSRVRRTSSRRGGRKRCGKTVANRLIQIINRYNENTKHHNDNNNNNTDSTQPWLRVRAPFSLGPAARRPEPRGAEVAPGGAQGSRGDISQGGVTQRYPLLFGVFGLRALDCLVF